MPWEPDYTTATAWKKYARITVADTDEDAQITTAIGMASRAVDAQAGRQFGKTAAETREYTARFSRSRGSVWYVETDDFQDTTGLAVSWDGAGDGTFSTAISPADCVYWPRNAAQRGRPFERVLFRPAAAVQDGRAAGVRVLALWGWGAVPTGIVGATNLQVLRMHSRREAPFGVAGSPDDGSEVRLLARLDPDVVVAVRRYARRAWAR